MPRKSPPIPVSAAAVAIGVVIAIASIGILLELSGRFFNSGAGITVPDTVTLTLDPNQRHAILRELAGAHITANRPLLDPPPDLAINITDARTGEPIPTQPSQWWYRQSIFGHTRHRTGLVQFTTPDHGQVTISVTGDFAHEQPYRITPTFDAFEQTYFPLLAASTAGGLIALAGLIGILCRVAANAKLAEDTPFSHT